MGYLTLKTEYNFGKTYGFLDRLFNEYSNEGYIGIADQWSTFGFYRLEQMCNAHNQENDSEWLAKFAEEKRKLYKNKGYKLATAKVVKPIYGIRVTVVEDATLRIKPRGQFGVEYIIISKNMDGLKQIFNLTSIGSKNFYYRENISVSDIENLDNDVFVIPTEDVITSRADYFGITLNNLVLRPTIKEKINHMNLKLVAIDDNFYPTAEDRDVYECFSGRNRDTRTVTQHILTKEEKNYYFEKEQIENIEVIAKQCEHFKLEKSKPAISIKDEDMVELIHKGAKKKGVDLTKEPYKSRIEEEIKIVKEKNFEHYFLIVSDIIRFAKRKSLVGVGRGSSGGSLACYCLDITDVDPIKHDLLFSRFISPERKGEPDIDTDYSDSYRGRVIKYIEKTYGIDNVKTISNVTQFKPRSALTDFAKALKIPEWEIEPVKDSIIDRAGGDNRSSFCISDTFNETDPGKKIIEEYPELRIVEKIEGHAKNKGKHAAGVIVSNYPLHTLCGVNNRDQSVHLNKNDAEGLGILKIDVLGLRTLSVLESVADMIGMKYDEFFNIDLEDKEVYNNIFRKGRLSGVFQFEGSTMISLNKEAPMDSFEDIACAQALARPGALASGGAARFVAIKNKRKEPKYYCKRHEEITKNTYGITVFQETMMMIAKEIANMTWEEVSFLRAAASKSYGDEWFAKFKQPFIDGCMSHSGLTEEVSEEVWKDIASSGSYSFNRCLSGDTEIRIANPNKYTKAHVTLDWYYKKYVSEIKPALLGKMLKGYRPKLMSLYPDGRCRPQEIVAIYKNGENKCYKYTFSNGATLECTTNHKFIINGKWEAIGPNGFYDYHLSMKSEFLIGEYDKRSCSSGTEMFTTNTVTIVSVEYVGVKTTYDIEMKEHHNFLLKGGIITHNSHAVSYGIISFWTAWAKHYHPMEFIASTLNHSKSDKDSLKMLREFYEKDGLQYESINPDTSDLHWSVKDGVLVGGLLNIDGFGVRKAQDVMKMRRGEKQFTPAILNTMFDPKTPYDILFPVDFHFYYIYDNPYDYTGETKPISYIEDIQRKDSYWCIGQVLYFDDINLNDYAHIQKRGYEITDGFDKKITFRIEDDTDLITMSVSRFDYEELKSTILNSKLDSTYVLVYGEVIFDHARIFMAKKIANLNEQLGLQIYDKKFSKIKRHKR